MYLLNDIENIYLQNKINYVYIFSQKTNRGKRYLLKKILSIKDSHREILRKLYEYNSNKSKDEKKYFIINSNNTMRKNLQSNL